MATPNKTGKALRTGVVIVWATLASCTVDFGSTDQPKGPNNSTTSAPAAAKSGDATQVEQSAVDLTGQEANVLTTDVATTSAANSPAKINKDPQQLLGLAGATVTLQLGVPSLIRRDGTAEIWQYRATACILDVFLYTNGDEQLVRHVELRSQNAGIEPQHRCFAEFLEAEKIRTSG